MSRFCSSGETYAKVAEAKKATVNNSLAQQRTLQWWTSNDEAAFQAHLKASGYDSEDDEEDEKLSVIDLTIRDDDDNDNTTNNNKKNKRQQSLDPPKKRESISSNKNRSKSLDAGSRDSICYLGIPHTFEDKDIEYINYCVEEGIDGARNKFVWNEVMFRCKHCSKPAISMERVQNPDRDVKYYPDHCGKCALEHISKEYIIERASTCGCNRERFFGYLSCYDCVHYTNRMGKLCGLIMRDGVRVGCGKEITSDNTKRIHKQNLCDGCNENYKVLTGQKQMTRCELCGYLLISTVINTQKCDGTRTRCPNEHAGRDGITKCSVLCHNVIQVYDVWWRCSGIKYQGHKYCAYGNKCKNDNPKAKTASGYNTVHLLNKWNKVKDAQMPNDYKTEQEITPIGIRHNSNKAKLYGKTPWDRSITRPTTVVDASVAPVAAAKAVTSKKAAPVAKKVPPAKKEPVKKKTYAKKATKKYDSSDEDEDSDDFMGNNGSDSEVSAPVPARERRGRAAAKKDTYVIDDSDEDESDEEND